MPSFDVLLLFTSPGNLVGKPQYDAAIIRPGKRGFILETFPMKNTPFPPSYAFYSCLEEISDCHTIRYDTSFSLLIFLGCVFALAVIIFLAAGAAAPDRPFHNFKASKSFLNFSKLADDF